MDYLAFNTYFLPKESHTQVIKNLNVISQKTNAETALILKNS